jgi:Protein of unknown function (DUF3515)
VALVATAVLVPVVVVVLVLVNVLGRDDGGDTPGPVADVSGAQTSSPREDLPPVEVDTPEITPAADLACPALMGQLPLELAGAGSRRVDSDSPYVYAWDDPPVVLVCGADPPAGYVVGAPTIVISGVEWFVDTTDPDVVVWTTVDRNVPVQVQVPASTDSASVTALCPLVATAIPYTAPTPAG